jgi:hypothetical protein
VPKLTNEHLGLEHICYSMKCYRFLKCYLAKVFWLLGALPVFSCIVRNIKLTGMKLIAHQSADVCVQNALKLTYAHS